jgi:transposase-like protein
MRKNYSAEVINRVVSEAVAEGNIRLVARRYGLSRNTVTAWIKAREEGRLAPAQLPSSAIDQVLAENRELKRLLGERELQVEVLEALLKKTAQRSATKSR